MAHYQQWHGTPYRWGGNNQAGLDCSAFVKITYKSVFNLNLPRHTRQQAELGKRVQQSKLQTGDLVFFKTGWHKYHVGIYVGKGNFMHVSERVGVTRSSLSSSYWSKRYWKARRIRYS